MLFLMVSALVPSILLVWYFRSRDTFPEPSRVLWATFGLGVLTVIPVLAVALPVATQIKGVEDVVLAGFLKAFLTAAGPEEFFKFLVVVLYAARHREFDEPIDGIVYGAVASLGFATLENVLYVSSGGLGVAILRAVTAVPAHAFMGALMGYFVGQAKFRPAERAKLLALGYFVPFVVHGLYDWPLLSMKGEDAAAGGEGGHPAFLLVTLVTLVIAWRATVRLTGRLRSEQNAWAQAHPALAAEKGAAAGVTVPGVHVVHPAPPAFAPANAYAPQGVFPQGVFPQGYAGPYAIAPQWGPPPVPAGDGTVAGVLLLIFGGVLGTVGGMLTLGGILSIVAPSDTTPEVSFGASLFMITLIGLLPLALGTVLFVLGIRKLNGK
jgi:RsiW-degrading membrane proteinase PrsW (M82 family)